MPRSKDRPLRPNERAALELGLVRHWESGDTAATMAAKFDTSKRRVVEALEVPFAQVRALERKGAGADVIAQEMSLPPGFVAYVLRSIQARATKMREQHQPPSSYDVGHSHVEAVRPPSPRGGPRPRRKSRPRQATSTAPKNDHDLDDWLKLE